MKHQIELLLQQALDALFLKEGIQRPTELMINIERPREVSHGDFSSNIAMTLAKVIKTAPRTLTERLIKSIPPHENIARIELAGPGFINFTLNNHYLESQFEAIWTSPTCGVKAIDCAATVVVDYSSPNLAKEMHVGHLRSTIIGDALAKILELKGYKVIRQNHVGDWGTQFGMLLAHLDDEERTHSGGVALYDLEQFYKAAKQRFDHEPLFAERARQWVVRLQSGDAHSLALWNTFIQLSLSHCQAIYTRLGVSLNASDVRAESAYNDDLASIVNLLGQKGLLVNQDGTQCVFLEEFKGRDNEPLPIIVQKKDGGFLYASTDLAAIDYRQKVLNASRVLYVVDARQTLHFQQIFALAYKAGLASPLMQLEHISFGMVLDKTGKPYKSRDGSVTKLADLLDEAQRRAAVLLTTKQSASYPAEELDHMAQVLGISSVKYADLSKNRTSDYIFDWDSMLSFEGNTAPYLLYAFTRIQSLFQKAEVDMNSLNVPLIMQESHEIALAKQLILFPEVIDAVAVKAMPHLLCTYLYELASLFSSFYEACPILIQNDKKIRESRLKLASLTARILKLGLSLLGIDTLARM